METGEDWNSASDGSYPQECKNPPDHATVGIDGVETAKEEE